MRFLPYVLSMCMTFAGVPVLADDSGDQQSSLCPDSSDSQSKSSKYKDLFIQCMNAGVGIENGKTVGMVAATSNSSNVDATKAAGTVHQTSAAQWPGAAQQCKNLEGKCASKCGTDTNCQTSCKNALDNKAACFLAKGNNDGATAGDLNNNANARGEQPAPQSTSSGGGGMSPLAAGAIGALAGGLLGYMLGKNHDKDKNKDDNNNDGALQSNGTLDCSKPDAYQYQDCSDYLSSTCASEIASGTYASDSKCTSFASTYCSGSSSAAVVATPTTPPTGTNLGDGAIVTNSTPPPAVPGSGMGTPFCQSALAYNYCQGGGRAQCPSCLGLAKTQNTACQTNPALCLAQNSQDQINAAKATCPTDPIFSNPAYAAGGTAVSTQLAGGAALPAVVLPQSSSGAASSTPATAAVAPGASGSSSGAAVASTGLSTASVGGASREGQTSGVGSAGGSGGGSASASANVSFHPSSVGGDRVASGGGGSALTARTPASASAMPTDVQGQFGPSLFAMSTQVIRSRCQAGKLMNCP